MTFRSTAAAWAQTGSWPIRASRFTRLAVLVPRPRINLIL
jgi:hypothetical protein